MANKNNHIDNIVIAAQKLFFHDEYDSVSMSSIAKSANVTKAALYYHFKNKNDLYLFILNKNYSFFKEKITELFKTEEFRQKNVRDKTGKILAIVFDFFILNKNSFLKIISKRIGRHHKHFEKFFSQAREDVIEISKPLSEEIIKYKNITGKVDHRTVTLVLFSTLNPFIYEYVFQNNQKLDSKELIDKICFLIFNK